MNHSGELEILLVNLEGVNREFGGDLVRTLRGDQQDRTLQCRNTRQHEIEQDERERIESLITIERQIGGAHVLTPVTSLSRMPSSA